MKALHIRHIVLSLLGRVLRRTLTTCNNGNILTHDKFAIAQLTAFSCTFGRLIRRCPRLSCPHRSTYNILRQRSHKPHDNTEHPTRVLIPTALVLPLCALLCLVLPLGLDCTLISLNSLWHSPAIQRRDTTPNCTTSKPLASVLGARCSHQHA